MYYLSQDELKILDVFASLPSRPSLAPQLRVLYWGDLLAAYANLFVGPTLRAVSLVSLEKSDDVCGVLANLIHCSPALERVEIHSPRDSQTSHALVTLDPTSWSRLRTLRLAGEIPPGSAAILGRLHGLRTLYVCFGGGDVTPPGLEAITSNHLFPLLVTLKALGSSPASIPIQLLLGGDSAPHLKCLVLGWISAPPNALYLKECFQLVRNRPRLRELSIYAQPIQLSPDTLELQATVDTIQPLFALKNLEDLTIYVPFALDDDALQTIAGAWPAMITLTLGGEQPYHRTNVTLCGLAHFVLNSPSLRHLALSFDASDVQMAWDGCRDIEYVCERLRRLWPGTSRIVDSSAVAGFLGNIFPRMRIMEDEGIFIQSGGLDPEGSRHRRRWARAGTLLRPSTTAT